MLLNATLDLSEYEIPTNAVLREVLRKKGFKATVVKAPFDLAPVSNQSPVWKRMPETSSCYLYPL